MTDIILGGPPIPLYEIDNLSLYDNEIYEAIISSENNIKSLYETIIKIIGNDLTTTENNINVIKDAQLSLTNANALYVSLLIGITLIIIIWMLCLTGLYNWIIALVLTLVVAFFIVILSFAYRAQCERIINEENFNLKTSDDLKNLISLFPKNIISLDKLKDSLHKDLYQSLIDIFNNKEIKSNQEVIEVKKGCGCGGK